VVPSLQGGRPLGAECDERSEISATGRKAGVQRFIDCQKRIREFDDRRSALSELYGDPVECY
jgi:hypothetical protein